MTKKEALQELTMQQEVVTEVPFEVILTSNRQRDVKYARDSFAIAGRLLLDSDAEITKYINKKNTFYTALKKRHRIRVERADKYQDKYAIKYLDIFNKLMYLTELLLRKTEMNGGEILAENLTTYHRIIRSYKTNLT